MKAFGKVHKYGDNVDTDVIIPARYLNSADPKELAAHCMEDIDKDFVNKVADGDEYRRECVCLRQILEASCASFGRKDRCRRDTVLERQDA